MKTGEIIRDILITNDLSQSEFASILGVSQKAVSNWVNGADMPKSSSIMLIYEKFHVTPNELLGVDEYYGAVAPVNRR